MPRAKSGRCRARAQDGKFKLEFVFTKDGKFPPECEFTKKRTISLLLLLLFLLPRLGLGNAPGHQCFCDH